VLSLKFLGIKFDFQYLFSFVVIALIWGVFLIYVASLIATRSYDLLTIIILSFILPLGYFLFSLASNRLKDRTVMNKIRDKELYEKYKEIIMSTTLLGRFEPTTQKAIELKKKYEKIIIIIILIFLLPLLYLALPLFLR
jgi:hypothetical protein